MAKPTHPVPDSLAADLEGSLGSVLRAVAATERVEPPVRLEPGTVVHEAFRVERELGSGGMGVVYLARDLRLGRDVALKLHTHAGVEAGAQRLWREAAALARLSHPHVVAVHEVGIHRDRVFVVMEYIDGGTMRDWLAREPRPWTAVLARFLEVAEGLCATHDAGLVHRDLKPENILIGKDGRARVTDFGLTRAAGGGEGPGGEGGSSEEKASSPEVDVEGGGEKASPGEVDAGGDTALRLAREALSARLTETGTLLGTPVYMAPEQLRGRQVDARADQFSFCVALYEALYGERPFVGSTIAELRASIEARRVRAAPAGAGVPRWVRKVLLRGLDPDPERRYPTLRALRRAIDERRRLRNRALLVVAGVALAGAASGATMAFAPREGGPTCGPDPAALRGVWDEERKRAVEHAFLGTHTPFAADAWRAVERSLDGYTGAWTAARRDACEATWVRGTQSPALLDRQEACLAERSSALGAFTSVLARADATVVEEAAKGAMGLPSIAACRDAEALSRRQADPSDPALAARAAALRQDVEAGSALELAGKYGEARVMLDRALEGARSLGVPALLAEAEVHRGRVLVEQGELAPAEVALTDGYFLARETGQDDLAARAALTLAMDVGSSLARPAEGMLWGRHALAAARRSPARGAPLEAQALRAMGILLWSKGKNDEARARLSEALVAAAGVEEDRRLVELGILESLGIVEASEGALEEALSHHLRALELAEAVHGPSHPQIVTSLGNVGLDHNDAGRPAEALPYLERALHVAEAAFGPDHPRTAPQLENLAVAEIGLGRHAQALGHLSRACEVLERSLGGAHPDAARCRGNLAEALTGVGRPADALVEAQKALAVFSAHYGPDHAEVARMTGNVGEILLALGRGEEAMATLRRSLAIWERTEPAHPWKLAPLGALGEALRRQGKLREARETLERALAVVAAGNVDVSLAARARFSMAQALWPEPGEHDRALSLARAAQASYEGLGESAGADLAKVKAWLASR